MKQTILFFLFAVITLQAGEVKTTDVDKKIIHHLFNSECSVADSLIELELQKTNNALKYLFLKAHFSFYARFLGTESVSRDSSISLVEEYAQKAIEKGLQEEPTLENRFYIGSSYGFLSRAYGMKQEYWNAFWAARDCQSYLESVLEDDPEFYDAYMGLGVIEYYAGTRIDGFLGAIAWLVGMSGDKDLGLEYFQRVADHGSILKAESQFALTILNRFLERNVDKSIPMMDTFLSQYPDNRMMNIFRKRTTMYEMIKNGNIDQLIAEKDSLELKYLVSNTYVLTSLAETLQENNLGNHSLKILQLNKELFPENARTYVSLAETYQETGNNSEARKYFNIALEKLPADELGTPDYKERVKEEILEKLESL